MTAGVAGCSRRRRNSDSPGDCGSSGLEPNTAESSSRSQSRPEYWVHQRSNSLLFSMLTLERGRSTSR